MILVNEEHIKEQMALYTLEAGIKIRPRHGTYLIT